MHSRASGRRCARLFSYPQFSSEYLSTRSLDLRPAERTVPLDLP